MNTAAGVFREARAWRSLVLGACAVVIVAGCESPGSAELAPLSLNDVQYIGTHNSYKQAIDPELLALMERDIGPAVSGLDYAHPPLSQQLAAGVRVLELDVFHDPDGGRYARPGGLELIGNPGAFDARAMHDPGFKVLHIQDLDFRSHCPTLDACLEELVRFSSANPDHLPIMVSVNAKQAPLDDPMTVYPLPFDAQAWRALDEAIRSVIGRARLFLPGDLDGGTGVREAVLARGFPPLDALRGRFLFVLDEPVERLEGYLSATEGSPLMFPAVPESHPMAGVLVLNDPMTQQSRIRAAVRAGFLVRTRADANTLEARSGSVARRDAALASGAQFISTDYPEADVRFSAGYRVRFEDGGLVRCNPLRVPAGCEGRRLE